MLKRTSDLQPDEEVLRFWDQALNDVIMKLLREED